ncbi:MAG: hypothetical protein JW827_03190 [Spirochaetes bacterium]|nr:hypothetical protein [Spirochaetota bacterium]
MKSRNEKLIKLLEQYHALPVKEQKKLKPVFDKTISRHQELGKNFKVIQYYFTNYRVSLELEPKQITTTPII